MKSLCALLLSVVVSMPALAQTSTPAATGPTASAKTANGQPGSLTATPTASKITGIVKDTSGKSVSGASVAYLFGGRGAVTDAAGAFELTWQGRNFGMMGGDSMLMVKSSDGQLVGCATAIQGTQMQITVYPAATATGIVTDSDGKPVPNAKMSLTTWYGNMGIGKSQGAAGQDGKYRIGGLCPNVKYVIEAEAEGYGKDSQTVRLEAGGTIEIAVPNLVLPPAKLTLSGVVVDAEGDPAPGVRVYVQGKGQPFRETTTDTEGKWKIDGIVDEKFQVGASEDRGGRYGMANAKGGDSEVVITLRQQSGSVPVGGASVSLLNKALPDLTHVGLKNADELAAGKRLLLVVWDSTQRPSRRCAQMLAARATELERKGVVMVLVHAATPDAQAAPAWLTEQKITLPAGAIPAAKATSRPIRSAGASAALVWESLGAKSLPWLVLTDDRHIVRAEGFAPEELDAKLAEPSPAAQPVH